MAALKWVEVDEVFDPAIDVEVGGPDGSTVKVSRPAVTSDVVYAAKVDGGTHFRVVRRDVSQVHLPQIQVPNEIGDDVEAHLKRFGKAKLGSYVLAPVEEATGLIVEVTVAAYFVPDKK